MTATQSDGVRQMQNGDPIWERIRNETREAAAAEPILASFLHATILNHDELECALSFHLANLLDSPTAPAMMLREVILEALRDDGGIRCAIRDDLNAILDRDSACHELYIPFLYFKDSRRCKSTASVTGCGNTTDNHWRIFYKARCLDTLVLIFTQLHALDTASCSITQRDWWWEKRLLSVTACRSCNRSRWAEQGKKMATVILKSQTASSSVPALKFWAIFLSVKALKWAQGQWYFKTCPHTQPSLGCLPKLLANRPHNPPRSIWTTRFQSLSGKRAIAPRLHRP